MRAYAAIDANGTVLVDTVSSSERAAKVNWLVTQRGLSVLASWTDETIDVHFQNLAVQFELARVAEVVVQERGH